MDVAPETLYARTRDRTWIAYQVVGEGPRDIVLFPFIASVDAMWEDRLFAHALSRLSQLGRLIVVDLRGMGSSDPVALGELPTVEAWADDALVALDAASSTTATVIGNGNFGGHVGLFLAATHPDRCDGLVLHNCAARGLRGDDYPHGLPPVAVERLLEYTEQEWGRGSFGEAVTPSRANDDAFRRWHARFERSAASPGVSRAAAEWGLTLDLRPVLPNVSVPTLVLHSVNNKMSRLEIGRYLAEHISRAKFVELPGGDQTIYGADVDDVLDHIEEFLTGIRPARHDIDRALATVLFSDIVSSTEHAARVGDHEWTALLDRHDDLVARELDRFRGRKVKSTGDGVLATFDGPARAVRCAQALIEAVRPLGIELRAGLHTGEIELRGEDIGGIAVHIGQRVSALAQPSQVLVSRTVTDLVAGSGINFTNNGEHELKGVPGTWQLYTVNN